MAIFISFAFLPLRRLLVRFQGIQSLYLESFICLSFLSQSLSLRMKENLTKEEEIMKLEQTLSEKSQKIEGYDSETQTIDLVCLLFFGVRFL